MPVLKEYESHVFPEVIRVNALVSVHSVSTEQMQRRTAYGEAHNFPELSFIAHGTSRNREGKPGMHAGQCIMIPPCKYHESTACDAAIIMIGFISDSPPLSQLYGRVFDLDEQQQLLLYRIAALGQRAFTDSPTDYNMVRRNRDNDLLLQKIKNLLELFLLELYEQVIIVPRATSGYGDLELFDEIKKYLKGNVDQNFTVEEISENCGVSVSKLKQLFSTNSTFSPMAYFTHLKMEQAKVLLQSTAYSITQIADILGYQSVSYFSRCFKKSTGKKPSEFARKE